MKRNLIELGVDYFVEFPRPAVNLVHPVVRINPVRRCTIVDKRSNGRLVVQYLKPQWRTGSIFDHSAEVEDRYVLREVADGQVLAPVADGPFQRRNRDGRPADVAEAGILAGAA